MAGQSILNSLIKNLKKNGTLNEYHEEIMDYIKRGVVSEVSRQEIKDWMALGNTACFISHHAVSRPDKATTKTCLVSNSSLKIGGKDWMSPNDCWPVGPNSLKPLLDLMVRFRLYDTALHFDIHKMYHAVHTGLAEKYMRLMLWQDPDTE